MRRVNISKRFHLFSSVKGPKLQNNTSHTFPPFRFWNVLDVFGSNSERWSIDSSTKFKNLLGDKLSSRLLPANQSAEKRPVTSHVGPRHTESTVYITSAYECRWDETNFHFIYSVKVRVHTERDHRQQQNIWMSDSRGVDCTSEPHLAAGGGRKETSKTGEREATRDSDSDGGHVTLNVFLSLPREEHQLSCVSSDLRLELLNEKTRTSRCLEVWSEPAEVDSDLLLCCEVFWLHFSTSIKSLYSSFSWFLSLWSFFPQIIQRFESEQRNRQTQMFLQVLLTSSFYFECVKNRRTEPAAAV